MSDQLPFDETPAATIIDRSTLQRYAECPHQAYAIEHGLVRDNSAPADIGNEVHRIVSAAMVRRSIWHDGEREIRDQMEAAANDSRPDIQPQVIRALRPSIWFIADLLCRHYNGEERAPEDLLRYDGGEGEHSGQLAAEFGPAESPVTLTCELDLLMASRSAEELDLYDWKSGWQHWTAGDVYDSFQFQFYSLLAMRNYPACKSVRVRVLMTAKGQATEWVEFKERDRWRIERRIGSAVANWQQYHDAKTVEDVPAWPDVERCSWCPYANRCRLASADAPDYQADPEAYLRAYAATAAKAELMAATLAKNVRKLGRDLVTSDGKIAFGTGKPKAARAATCDLYDPTAKN